MVRQCTLDRSVATAAETRSLSLVSESVLVARQLLWWAEAASSPSLHEALNWLRRRETLGAGRSIGSRGWWKILWCRRSRLLCFRKPCEVEVNGTKNCSGCDTFPEEGQAPSGLTDGAARFCTEDTRSLLTLVVLFMQGHVNKMKLYGMGRPF